MQPLVPVFITNAYEQGRDNGRFTAVAVQVDLSGFTNLTTTIMNHSRDDGGEIVADMMRHTFNPLVDSVDQYGGFIGMFAGDAFTAFFPYEDDTKLNEVAHAALMAIWTMQGYVENLSLSYSFGNFRFAIKTGMGVGEVDWRIFHNPYLTKSGTDTQRTVYSFSGAAVEDCIRAIDYCETGDIYASDTLISCFTEKELVLGEPQLTYSPILDINYSCPTVGLLYPDTETHEQAILPFVPKALRQKTGLGEFRQVVSLFVGVDFKEHDLTALETFAQTIYDLQALHGGYLNAIRYGDKGYVAVLFWGAPVVYENDVQLAVAFANALRQRSPFPVRVGVTYRWLYAGLIGADSRQDYSCYGGGTSFAARLMVSAEYGTIRLDESVATRLHALYEMNAVEKRPFKGFDDEVWVYELEKERALDTAFSPEQPFVGRSDELLDLHDFVQPIFSDRFAGVFIVRGEAGSGKSRLVAEWRQQLTAHYDDRLAWSYCQADEIVRTDLNPFRYFLRSYFQQSPEDTPEVNRERFDAIFDIFSAGVPDIALKEELRRTQSFLAALLGIYWDDSLYSRLSPRLRQPNTEQALITFFLSLCRFVPVVLHIEDAHWLDEASVRLLAKLTEQVRKDGGEYALAIVITMRDPVELEWEEIAAVLEGVAMRFALLGSLSKENIRHLAEKMLHHSVNDTFVDFLRERTAGNPFFVEQTVLYLQDQDHLILVNDELSLAAGHSDIASDVRAVLLARIDRLLPEVRSAVQTASVLGREFRINVLRFMLADTEDFETHIAMAHEANIWIRLLELNYLFRHALLRDMAYQMQLQSRRQHLHAMAFEAILTLYRSDLRPYYGELAYHAEQAQLIDDAIEYLEKAGDASADVYQNEQAVKYYNRCRHLLTSVKIAFDNDDSENKLFTLLQKIATIYWQNMDRYTESEQVAREALALAHKSGDMAKIADGFASILVPIRRQYRTLTALSYAQHALHYYESVQDFTKIAQMYDRIALIYRYMNQWEHTLSYTQKALDALEQAEEGQADNLVHAEIYTMLGVCWDHFGDYTRAVEFHHKAEKSYLAQKYDPGYANAISNIAFIQASCGQYEESIENYQKALVICRKFGSPRLSIRMQGNLGNVLARLGRFEEAEDCFAEAFVWAYDIQARFELCWMQAYYADMQFALGDYGLANEYSQNSYDIAESLPHLNYMIRAKLLQVQVLYKQEQFLAARELLDFVAPLAKSEAQKADILYVDWLISRKDAVRIDAMSLYQALVKKTPKIDYINRIEQMSL